jgi:DNA invertase Pin-like site-specific DNA recombinase
MKYFAYCRKSSQDDSHQAQSIETQIRILKDFSITNNVDIVDFVVETRSAKDDGNRPEFDKMLKRFEKEEADGLLVCHIDRISRNWIEAGQISKLYDLKIIKEIRTPSKIYNTAQDMFMMGIELASASYYSRNLSVRVKEGIATKLSKGEYISIAPLGYTYKDRLLIPDPKTKNFVIKAFKLYATGDYSLKKVTETLYSEGFRTRKANKKVHISVIHRILTNPIFYGFIFNKGKLYKGSYKPLISKSLFDQVQSILNGDNHPRYRKHNFLFSKYLFCNECGCRLTATTKKGKYVYYYCTNGKKNCSQHKVYLREEKVKDVIGEIFSKITIDPEIASLSLELYADELRKNNQDKIGVSQIITTQIDNLKKKSKRLFDLYLNQEITKVDYEERKLEIENEQLKLKEDLNNSKNFDLDSTLELLEKLKNSAISLKKMYMLGNKDVKANLLKSALWNCKIQNGIIQKVTYKKPYSYFENMGKIDDFSIWQRL